MSLYFILLLTEISVIFSCYNHEEPQSTSKAKKKKCVFTVTCWKKLGSVGRNFFFLNLFFITELMLDGI